MIATKKLSLQLNDFRENTSAAFVSLREDTDFTDVTLVCEDGQLIYAHKVILATSSPFFQNILRQHKHAHPIVYMRGVKAEDLVAIVDFIYYGEANIFQKDLETFLSIAEDLNLKGLIPKLGDNIETEPGEVERELGACNKISGDEDHPTKTLKTKSKLDSKMNFKDTTQNISAISKVNTENLVVIPKQEFSGELKDLDKKVQMLMVLGENKIMMNKKINKRQKAYICQVCGKEGQMMQIRDHIEAQHIEGISIPCNVCTKFYSTRSALRQHKKTALLCNEHTLTLI